MRPRRGLDPGSVWAQRLWQLEQRLRVRPRHCGGRGGDGRALERQGGTLREVAGPVRPLVLKAYILGLTFGRESSIQQPIGIGRREAASPRAGLEMGLQNCEESSSVERACLCETAPAPRNSLAATPLEISNRAALEVDIFVVVYKQIRMF